MILRRGLLSIFLLLSVICISFDSNARPYKVAFKPIEKGKSVILMDAQSGQVMYEENALELRYPASLTKMMTLYIVFDALERTSLTKNTLLTASDNVAKQPSTNIELKKGQRISIHNAIKALIVRSANDVATLIAESFAGSEEKFAKIMTYRARKLGMNNTVFKNASGLPNSKQHTTIYDIAILVKALQRDFPQHYHYFGTTEFSWGGKEYNTHNKLMTSYPGVDGLKTGYIRASGFHLASSYKNPVTGQRLIAIYMGADRPKERRRVLSDLLKHAEKNKLKSFAYKRREFKPTYYAMSSVAM